MTQSLDLSPQIQSIYLRVETLQLLPPPFKISTDCSYFTGKFLAIFVYFGEDFFWDVFINLVSLLKE